MAFNFPSSPVLDQTYTSGSATYRYNGSAWVPTVYAAPFDAMAYSGMQINGGMEVNQVYGAIMQTGWLGFNGYLTDGWRIILAQATAGSTAFSAGVSASGLTGIPLSIQLTATGAANFAGATDVALLHQYIEGYRWARLGFGYANAQPVTVSFWIYATKAGTGHVLVGGGNTQSRSYIKSFTVNVAATWEYKTLTFPPDVTGGTNWTVTNEVSGQIFFCFGGGTTTTSGVLDTWTNWTNQFASPSQTNFFSGNGDSVFITGVTVLPGTQAPTAAQSPNIMRPYDQELVTCQRYWEKSGSHSLTWSGKSIAGYIYEASNPFKVCKRAVPTVTFPNANSGGLFATIPATFTTIYNVTGSPTANNTTDYAYWYSDWIADARL